VKAEEIDGLLKVIADEALRVRRVETELELVDEDPSPNLTGLRKAVDELCDVQQAKITLAGLPRADLDAAVRRRHQLLAEDPR
jgi:hypothetical protein